MVSKGIFFSTQLSSHTLTLPLKCYVEWKEWAGEDSRKYPIKYLLFINLEIEFGLWESKSDTSCRLWKRRWQMSSASHLLHALCHHLCSQYSLLKIQRCKHVPACFKFFLTLIFNVCFFFFTLLKVLPEQLCCAKSLQSHLTLSDPMDCSPPGSSVHGILQARILEWVAMPSSIKFLYLSLWLQSH